MSRRTFKTLVVERTLKFLTREVIVKIGKKTFWKDNSVVDSKGIGD